MERDFMGIRERDQLLLLDEKPKGSGVATPVHRPLPSKASAIPQFVPFKPSATQDQKMNQTTFNRNPTTGFYPVLGLDGHPKMNPQKNFLMGNQAAKTHMLQGGFAAHGPNRCNFKANPHLSTDPRMPPMAFGSSYLRTSNPGIQPGQPFPVLRQQNMPGSGSGSGPNLKTPMLGCANGASIPSSVPPATQLTIFYGGYVSVYDNVPLEEAQAIMFMASNSSNMATDPPVLKTQAPIQPPPKLTVAPEVARTSTPLPKRSNSAASPRSGFSSPISAVSHSAAHSSSSSSNPDERKGHNSAMETAKMAPPPANEDSSDPSTTSIPRGPKPVPMMRKLSLARFLEKRKERFTNLAPYPLNGKPFENAHLEIGKSSGKEWSWQSSTPKNSSVSNHPNTKLEI